MVHNRHPEGGYANGGAEEDVKEILRASYDRSASEYDARFRALQWPKYRALLGARAERLARALARGRVLDLGAGTGLVAAFAREAGVEPDERLLALDLSAAMLARARARGLVCVHADLERLPFRDARFEAVCAFTSLGLVPGAPIEAALREVARVVVPGGWFALSVLAHTYGPHWPVALERAGFDVGAPRACGQDTGLIAHKRA